MSENNKSDIESESLSAHVAICTLRYQNLDDKLESVKQNVNDKMDSMDDSVTEIKKSIAAMKDTLEDREATLTNRIIGWGIYIIGALLTVCGTILYHYLIAPRG